MEIVLWESDKIRISLYIGRKGKTFCQKSKISIYKEYLLDGGTCYAEAIFSIN